jgi:cobalt-zinc-cadmium efflux system outer membrane protein
VKHYIIAIASALLFAAGSTLAQDKSSARATLPDPALDALVSTAIENTPELAAAHAAVEAARRRVEPARTLGDPSLSTTYQNDGRSLSLGRAEGSFVGLMLSQPLPWPGKLALAGQAAASEAREIESGTLGRAGLTIEARVRNSWYDLILARGLDRLIEERRDTARQIEATTRNRYAAGLAEQQDVLRAQVELARIGELKAAQRAIMASRLAELNRLLGLPQDAALVTPADLPSPAAMSPAAGWIASALGRSPEAAAARQAVATGRVRVQIARKNFFPDFMVSGGSMYRGNFEMGPMWQVGVGVSLPIWVNRRQQNQLAEAQARVAEQTAQTDVVSLELELRTRERIAQLEAASGVAILYGETIVPLDQLSYESALASYQAGKVPFVTVFEAVNVLYGDRASYLGRLAEAAKWRVAIDEAALQPTAMGGAPAMPSGGGAAASGMSAQGPASSSSSSNAASTSMR